MKKATMEFEEDIRNLVKVSLFASISLGYCYFLGKTIPKGFLRLLTIIPIVLLFFSIPLFFNSVHLIGVLSLYISWLANFKLLLFAFEKGPLSAPSISLYVFLSFACFPIEKHKKEENPSKKSIFNYGVKVVLLAIFLKVYHDYGDNMNRMIAWILFACSVYFFLELILAMSSMIVELLLGIKLDPQFDEPYLSTSLQDFWGRRWNLMVNRVLYPTIYYPVRTLSTRVIGRMWAPIPAVLTTFAISGLMHELIFFYFTRDWPTWHTMFFFCIHGVSLVIEIVIKKSVNLRWSLPRYKATPLVVIFVLGTSYWLFFPELLRCKLIERAFEDYQVMTKIATSFV